MNPHNQQNPYANGWNAAHGTNNPAQNNAPEAAVAAAAAAGTGPPQWQTHSAQWGNAAPTYMHSLPTSMSPRHMPVGMPLSSPMPDLHDLLAQSAKQLEHQRVHMLQQQHQQASMQLIVQQQQQLAQQMAAQKQMQRHQQQLTPLITGDAAAAQASGPNSANSASSGATFAFSSLDVSSAPAMPVNNSSPSPLASPMPLLSPVSPDGAQAAVSEPTAIGQLPPMLPIEMDAGMESAAAFMTSDALPAASVKLERSLSAEFRSGTSSASQSSACSSSPNPPRSNEELSAEELAALDQRSMYAGRRMACAGCHAVKSSCEGGRPCARCVRVGRPCIQREKARVKKQSDAKSHKKMATPLKIGGAAATGAGASSSTWSPGQFRSPPSESTNSSGTSSASRSQGDTSSPSLTTSPYPSPLVHSMRVTSRESSANAAGSPVHKLRKLSQADEDSPGANNHHRASSRSILSQTQRSRSPSEAMHSFAGMGLRSDSEVFDAEQVAASQPALSTASSSGNHAIMPYPPCGAFSLSAPAPVVDVTAILSAKCLINHLATDSLAKVRSKVTSKEWSGREAQRFVAELVTQLTVADIATLVERAEGPSAASSSLTTTMHRLHALLLLPSSPLFMLSWHASPLVVSPSANADAELVIERLPVAPPSPNAGKRKRELESAASTAGGGAAASSDDPEPVSACAVPMAVSSNLALHQLLGYSQPDLRDRYIQFGMQTPLMFLRPDYVGPYHLLQLQCSLERIHEFVCFAVFRSRYGMDLYLCCHVKSDTDAEGTVERTRTVYRMMPSGPLPPCGAHINLLQPYPAASSS